MGLKEFFGVHDKVTCLLCAGSGTIRPLCGPYHITLQAKPSKCHHCNGTGKLKVCPNCGGTATLGYYGKCDCGHKY